MMKLAIGAMANGVATLLLATATLTSLAAVVGILGGVAGFYAVFRVTRLAGDVNAFLSAQNERIDAVRDEEPPEGTT